MQKEARKRSRLAAIVLAVTAAILLFGACSSTRTVGEQVDDGWITTKIESKLAGDPEVSAFNVDVDTLDGVVTLKGAVKSQEAKAQAEEHARETEGVTRVVNQIVVEP
jgi:hyperosmotically inducible periplasmic protein